MNVDGEYDPRARRTASPARSIAPATIWTHRKPDDLVHKGDVIDVRVSKVDAKVRRSPPSSSRRRTSKGAVLAIDNHTGQILAMIGGADFEHSQFNRATQALRQVGSLFKPFVYTAAIDRGYTAITILPDDPASYNVGPEPAALRAEELRPASSKATVTLRQALEDSRNVPTVRLDGRSCGPSR